MKKQVPTEAEVRRFFQTAYYTTLSYDSETGNVKVGNDRTQLVYPTEEYEEDDY